MSNQFKSNAEEIRYHTIELLKDGEEHTKDEIRSYLQKHTTTVFTPGMISGAIYDMLNDGSGRFTSPKRGVYQQMPQRIESTASLPKEDFKQRTQTALQNAIQLLNEACTVNILLLSREEMEISGKMKDAIDFLQQKFEEIG